MDSGDAGLANRAALSGRLLERAKSGQKFLGFISYRRADGQALAQWLRSQLTGFAPPHELKARVGARDEGVGGSQNRVFLDVSYQRPNVDFWDEHIGASLCRSNTLILLQTPSIFQHLDNGEPNWCEREIETFLNFSGDPSRVLVVMGPGAPIDRFPAPLSRISARWDWIDLRFFTASPLRRLQHAHEYDAQVAKILAKLYDIPDGDLPILNREFARARARVRRAGAVAAAATIAGLSALTAWAMVERSEALLQRNAALAEQSRFLAETADRLVAAGRSGDAGAVVRQALPDPAAGRERPLMIEAVGAAYRAIFNFHERAHLAMPDGATAIATDGHAGRIVIAAGAKLHVRDGFSDVDARTFDVDFAPAGLTLAPDGQAVAMIGRDGEIALKPFSAEKAGWRRPGVGPKASAYFLAKGERLLAVAEDARLLRLYDAATGAILGEFTLTVDADKPLSVTVDAASERIYVVAEGQARRLSPQTLAVEAQAPVADAEEYAATLSADKSSLYLAAAKHLLEGRLFELDAQTLAVKRDFGGLAWGAGSLAADARGATLAVNGQNGVDFFNLHSGERSYRVFASENVQGGRFVGRGESGYLGFGALGQIRRWTVEIGADAGVFANGDPLQAIDVPEGGDSFLAVSSRPSATLWSFAPTTIRSYGAPMVVRDIKLDMDWAIMASSVSDDGAEATAAYLDGTIRRWTLATGAEQVAHVAKFEQDKITQVVTVADGVTAAVRASGQLETYAPGANAPRASAKIEALNFLGPLDADAAFAITTTGAALRIGLKNPAEPRIETLSGPGSCEKGASGAGSYLCVNASGPVHLRRADGQAPVDLPAPATRWTAIQPTPDRALIFIAEMSGRMTEWRRDGTQVRTFDLTSPTRGEARRMAIQALHLAGPAAGAADSDLALPAVALAASDDGRRVAAGLFLGAVKLIDADTGRIREVRPISGPADIQGVAISPNGKVVAVIASTRSRKQGYREIAFYDYDSGAQLASLAVGLFNISLYASPDGRGFATIDASGRIEVYPVFERTDDLIAYLAKTFPKALTPEQKRAFYIE